MVNLNIGNKLKVIRKLKGLTTSEVAQKVNVSQSYISRFENNKAIPDVEMLANICSALGLTLAEFFADTSDQEPLPPDICRLLDLAKQLTPRQREILLAAAEEWANLPKNGNSERNKL